jgi:hypothetical protein
VVNAKTRIAANSAIRWNKPTLLWRMLRLICTRAARDVAAKNTSILRRTMQNYHKAEHVPEHALGCS